MIERLKQRIKVLYIKRSFCASIKAPNEFNFMHTGLYIPI